MPASQTVSSEAIGEAVHARGRRAGHRFETALAVVPHQQAGAARDPHAAIGRAHHLLAQLRRPADRACRRRAIVSSTRPAGSRICTLLPSLNHSVPSRCTTNCEMSAAERRIGVVSLDQRCTAPLRGSKRTSRPRHPIQTMPSAVFVHAEAEQVAAHLAQAVLDRAGLRIQPVEHAAAADQPQSVAGRRRDAVHEGVGRRSVVAFAARQHGEVAPVGRQVPQTRIAAAEPQPALAVLVRRRPRRPHDAAAGVAVQRHVLDDAVGLARPARCGCRASARPAGPAAACAAPARRAVGRSTASAAGGHRRGARNLGRACRSTGRRPGRNSANPRSASATTPTADARNRVRSSARRRPWCRPTARRGDPP